MKYEDLKIPACKNFSGYKPCYPFYNCLTEGCKEAGDSGNLGTKILIISLDALGNVLLNTSILPSLKKKYPVSTVHWITQPSAVPILSNNDYIDKVFSWNDEDRMIVRNMKYDVLLNSDKSVYACSFADEVSASEKFGFLTNGSGKIIPANSRAMYNYFMGIDDNLKFRENKRSGSEIIHETFGLDYSRSEYVFAFSESELDFIEKYKAQISYDPSKVYAGFNTGCSNLFPNKKMTVEQHIELIRRLAVHDNLKLVLLGGKEDTERNLQIYEGIGKELQGAVIYTPTNLGLRNGACFMNICDIVITGDSFGMHLAIALRKFVIAWFGLSCWNEIDLYERGEKLYPEGLECAPCWKKQCPYNLECIEMIDLGKITELVRKYSLVKTIITQKN
ncbi:MAG: lipopolysaccharide heptosyltransferase family protein [Ignavibacteria bacterium]|nr:lipopolysaccharide heptosyltransferase family protein [Ignavibacteria bacterium]